MASHHPCPQWWLFIAVSVGQGTGGLCTGPAGCGERATPPRSSWVGAGGAGGPGRRPRPHALNSECCVSVQAESVWVFECCCLLFFKGLLALPWGCCSRNSYLCFSPAYRPLTGTTWPHLLIVCCLSACFPAHGIQLFVPQCSFSCFI